MVTFTHKKVVNNYIDFGINLWPCNNGKDFASVNSSFGSDKLLKKLILISTDILAMVLDLMSVEVFRYRMVVGLVKM